MLGKSSDSDEKRPNGDSDYYSGILYSPGPFSVMDSKMHKFSAKFLLAFIP